MDFEDPIEALLDVNPAQGKASIRDEEVEKLNYNRLHNKSKDLMNSINYTRRKHFKSNTLRTGEGQMFLNKGVTNKEYEESILKRSLI